jgi:hypothetical protein
LVTQRDDGEGGSANGVTKSPLEHLDDVLNEISADQSYMLKRELLVGLVPEAPKDLKSKGSANM